MIFLTGNNDDVLAVVWEVVPFLGSSQIIAWLLAGWLASGVLYWTFELVFASSATTGS
mgnify:CR=1 FL=1